MHLAQESQDAAVVMSSQANDALHRLLSPLRRVEYILEREGYHVGDHESPEDPEVLMETMEMREQIESAESKEEVEQVQATNGRAYICHILASVLTKCLVKLAETLREITDLVAKKDWPAVKAAAIKLKYLEGIEKAAEAWPHPLGSDH